MAHFKVLSLHFLEELRKALHIIAGLAIEI